MWRSVIINYDIKNYFSNGRIKWNFIPQLSPWAGGFYERLVGIVKRSLRKSIGKVYLDIIQLQTILAEVEAVVNTRPIIYICDDIDLCTLTPAHFLTLNYRIDFPEMIDIEETDYIPGISSSQTLLETWKKGQRHLSNFWKVWKNEYLAQLRERDQCYHKNNRNKSECDPHIGDVVLIQEGQPRSQWRIGKIIEFLTSSDGEKRTAKVLLPSQKNLVRSIKHLYPIECPESIDEEMFTDSKHENMSIEVIQKGLRIPSTRLAAMRAKERLRKQFNECDSTYT